MASLLPASSYRRKKNEEWDDKTADPPKETFAECFYQEDDIGKDEDNPPYAIHERTNFELCGIGV